VIPEACNVSSQSLREVYERSLPAPSAGADGIQMEEIEARLFGTHCVAISRHCTCYSRNSDVQHVVDWGRPQRIAVTSRWVCLVASRLLRSRRAERAADSAVGSVYSAYYPRSSHPLLAGLTDSLGFRFTDWPTVLASFMSLDVQSYEENYGFSSCKRMLRYLFPKPR